MSNLTTTAQAWLPSQLAQRQDAVSAHLKDALQKSSGKPGAANWDSPQGAKRSQAEAIYHKADRLNLQMHAALGLLQGLPRAQQDAPC